MIRWDNKTLRKALDKKHRAGTVTVTKKVRVCQSEKVSFIRELIKDANDKYAGIDKPLNS